MKLDIRRALTIIDHQYVDAGRRADRALVKVAEIAVLANPYAGNYVEDLAQFTEASIAVAKAMAARLTIALGGADVEGYGKGGIVGLSGEKEHANALLTTAFAAPLREAIGGGEAWISSVTKVAPPGTPIDVPMNSRDDVYVRSHYDTMSIVVPEAPLPDEIALIFCVSSRGRLNARVGGLTLEDVRSRRLVSGGADC